MKANALYFPYINVPRSDWLYAMALYWDKVSAIVPYDYLYNSEKFSPFMRDLVRKELVTPVIPTEFIPEHRKFAEPFLSYVENKLKKRNTSGIGENPNYFQIHIEKIEYLVHDLEDLGVLKPAEYPWFDTIDWVAEAFMAYLATCIGLNPRINAQPVTDDYSASRLLGLRLTTNAKLATRRNQVRNSILTEILPVPKVGTDITKLLRFKEKNFERLRKFRTNIEETCLDLANRPVFSEEQVDAKASNLREETTELAAKMKASWGDVTFRDFLPLASLGISIITDPIHETEPVIRTLKFTGVGLALTAAVDQFADSMRENFEMRNEPLAYAALAGRIFRNSSRAT
jgi:hypothetical protein